jgi:polyamine oxidase
MVTITTDSGNIFKSTAVLITASIGVLQAGTINFVPPMPAWKTKAIANAKITSYVKVFVNWQKRWWDDLVQNP